MTREEFEKGWAHFCNCIDFARSALDAEAIGFMNEAPAKIAEALETGDELKRAELKKEVR